MPTAPTTLIVNPNAHGGRVGRHFGESVAALRAVLGDFAVSYTSAAGDGAQRCREALAAGARLVVAVGGDGTASLRYRNAAVALPLAAQALAVAVSVHVL